MSDTYIIEYVTHNDYDVEVSDLYPVGNLIASEDKLRNYFGKPIDDDIYLGWNILINDEESCVLLPQKEDDADIHHARAWAILSESSEVVQTLSFILDSALERVEPVEEAPKKKPKKKSTNSLADLEEECYDNED
jgi:hypothetical protein